MLRIKRLTCNGSLSSSEQLRVACWLARQFHILIWVCPSLNPTMSPSSDTGVKLVGKDVRTLKVAVSPSVTIERIYNISFLGKLQNRIIRNATGSIDGPLIK